MQYLIVIHTLCIDVRMEPNTVANPICRGQELESPEPLTLIIQKIQKSISVNPPAKVAPNRIITICFGAERTYLRFFQMESVFGGMKEPPRIQESTNVQMNLHSTKFRWYTPAEEWVHRTALFMVAQESKATRHMRNPTADFVGMNMMVKELCSRRERPNRIIVNYRHGMNCILRDISSRFFIVSLSLIPVRKEISHDIELQWCNTTIWTLTVINHTIV